MNATELLQAIQALGDQPKITVSVEVKRNVGEYESVTGKAFLSMPLPAGTTMDEMLEQYAELNAAAYAIAEAEAEDSYQRFMEAKRQQHEERLSEQAIAREQGSKRTSSTVTVKPAPEKLEAAKQTVRQTQPQAEQGGRQLQRAPKAADRVPGDWWYETANSYAISTKEGTNPQTGDPHTTYTITFSKDELQYPIGSIEDWRPGWPSHEWFVEKVGEVNTDGFIRRFEQPVRIKMQVSAKQNSKGNYYVDVVEVA